MKDTDLRLIYVSFDVLWPPLPKFRGNRLHELFAALSKIHHFESFSQTGDGAVMSTEGERTVEIDRDSLAYRETVQTDFALVRRTAEDIVRFSLEQLKISTFLLPGITMRALWPGPSDAAEPISQVLREQALSLKDDQYRWLGNVHGAGIHLFGDQEAPRLHWHLELDPYMRDEGQLYVILQTYFDDSFETYTSLGECLTMTYDFLSEKVARFVRSFLP